MFFVQIFKCISRGRRSRVTLAAVGEGMDGIFGVVASHRCHRTLVPTPSKARSSSSTIQQDTIFWNIRKTPKFYQILQNHPQFTIEPQVEVQLHSYIYHSQFLLHTEGWLGKSFINEKIMTKFYFRWRNFITWIFGITVPLWQYWNKPRKEENPLNIEYYTTIQSQQCVIPLPPMSVWRFWPPN